MRRISPSKGKAGQFTNGGRPDLAPLERGVRCCEFGVGWAGWGLWPEVLADATPERYRIAASLESTGIHLLVKLMHHWVAGFTGRDPHKGFAWCRSWSKAPIDD
ncbi:hypothetical protein GCM10028833_29050 [Glycomyces tarimensis]